MKERRSTGSIALDNLSMSLDDILEGHKLEVDSTEYGTLSRSYPTPCMAC